MNTELRQRADALIREARYHGKEAGREALRASIAMERGWTVLAEAAVQNSARELALANHCNEQVKALQGAHGL